MINNIQRMTLKQAIITYGEDKQQLVAIEELSELQKAIVKFFRKPDNPKCAEDIAEEMADVYIMLKQLEIIHKNTTAVGKNIHFKIKRLADRLQAENR